MYEVVSRGIIRAGLRWMNMPQPRLEMCQNFTFPNGVQTCSYRAHFNADEAEKRVMREWRATHEHEFSFNELLEECFARDVTVLPEPIMPWSGEVTYILICRLYPREMETLNKCYEEDRRNANTPTTQGMFSPDEQTVMSDIPF